MSIKTLHLIFTFFAINFCTYTSFSQSSHLDSLQLALKNAKHDTTRIRLRAEIGEVASIFRIGYWDTLAKESNRLDVKKIEAASFNNIGFLYYNQGETTKAFENLRRGLQIQEELNDKNGLASSLNNIAALYENQGDISMAISYYQKSLKTHLEIGDKEGTALLYNNIGLAFNKQADINNALQCFNNSLKINEEIGNKKGQANSLNSIALIYNNQGDLTKALEYFTKSLKLFEEAEYKAGTAYALINIGTYYKSKKEFKKALEYYNKSLKIREELGDKRDLAAVLSAIGSLNFDDGNPTLALIYFEKSLIIQKATQDKRGIANTYNCIGAAYLKLFSLAESQNEKQKNFKLALSYTDSSLTISKNLGIADCIFRAERLQSRIDSASGNYKGAFEHYKQFIIFRDSITNETNRKASIKSQLKYEYDKKEAVIKEQQEKERLVAQEKNRFQQIVIWSVIVGLLLVIVFAGYIVRTLRTTRVQKAIIEEKQREILDSIHYAKRIQKSLLPTEKYIHSSLKRMRK